MPSGSVSGEAALPGQYTGILLLAFLCAHVAKEVSLVSPSLLIRTLALSDQSSTLGPFLTSDLHEDPVSKYSCTGRAYGFCTWVWGAVSQSIALAICQATAKNCFLPGTLPSFKLGAKWQIQIKLEVQYHFICHSSKCDILSTLWLLDLVNGLRYVPLRASWKKCSMIHNCVDWGEK